MGYDLSSRNGEYFRASIHTFGHLRRLGLDYGWQPAGTKWNTEVYRMFAQAHAEDEGESYDAAAEERQLQQMAAEWRGGYWSNDFQIVIAEDAAAWAAALEQALDDLPDHNAMAHLEEELTLPDGSTMTVIPTDSQYTVYEFFSGDQKEYLREFIEFCRLGEFRIG